MSKGRVRLDEAIKISLEIDPSDVEGLHREPERLGRPPGVPQPSGGSFESYVRELNVGSRAEGRLLEAAREVNRVVSEVLEDVGLREDRREAMAAQHHAVGRVLREWRAFLRSLSEFEGRFR